MGKLNERYSKQIEFMENIIYDTTFGELPAKEFAKACAQRLFHFGFGYVADIVADYEEEKKDLQSQIQALQREISELKDEQELKSRKEYYENIVGKIREIVERM